MSPSPSLTFKVFFCLVCRVHQSHHNYTGPPRCMAVSPKGSLTFSFSSKPCGAGSNAAPKVFKWSPVSNELCFSLEWHTDPKTWSFFASYPNLINHWEILSSQPHIRTPSPHQVCLSCPVNISITSRAAGGSAVTSVMLSNSWAIHTSVAPTI